MGDAAPLLQIVGVTKRFGTIVANDAISLDLEAGEVLALLGENGAGKSTLVSILFGHYVADAGTITMDGQRLPAGEPKAARDAGIGMVHQHFALADNLSVLDNVLLGREPLWRPYSRRKAARERLADAARRFGLHVDPDAMVGRLSVGERQRVEILKALFHGDGERGARILILDEPTAVLTPAEADALFSTLRQLVSGGLAVIFISHRLDEVLRVSQRIAVLRGGRLVAMLATADANKALLAETMVGRPVSEARRSATAAAAERLADRKPVCRLQGVGVGGSGGAPGLIGIDLELRAGEVVAIAGVAGNGQQLLAELLFGLRRQDQGTIEIGGRVLPARPRCWIDAGVARIPEDRQAVGAIGDLPVSENAVLERAAQRQFARAGIVRRRAVREHAAAIVKRFDVRGTEARGLDTPARSLSGGNLQKLILGRALMVPAPASNRLRLVVADQPTWGLDIGAVAYVHQQLLDVCLAGAAVLLISEDLDEVFALADRIAVLHAGRLTAARPQGDWTLAEIGLAMAGQSTAPVAAEARDVAA